MKNFVRGSNVHIGVVFFDRNGNPINPTGANVTLSYRPKNNTQQAPPYTFTTFPLVSPITDDEWTLDWDSSVSSADIVYCHAATTTVGTPIATIDFSFRLTANRANKELAGDDDTWGGAWSGYWR